MNRYFEKVAQLYKVAFDGDYEEGGEYGICANRPILGRSIYASLHKALKDPHVTVDVDGYRSSQGPDSVERIRKLLTDMETSHRGPDGKPYWPRTSSWSIGMKVDNPHSSKFIGKEDHDGWDIESPQDAIRHYIHTKFNP